jgi:methylated-DNA-protein-cysteine methyltransferase-like protein
MTESFHEKVVRVIKKIPKGKVATYGQIAAMAGSPRAARQVVRALHSSSRKEKLPWYRVINSQGKIGLKEYQGYDLQKALLEKEGVKFGINDIVDLNKFQWNP